MEIFLVILKKIIIKILVKLIPDWLKLSVERKLVKLYLLLMLFIFVGGGIGFLGFIIWFSIVNGEIIGVSYFMLFFSFVCFFFSGKIFLRMRKPY